MSKAKKIIFLGIDAALPDLVKKFVSEGNMPNMKRLMDQGYFSRIETVFPPLTAAGWAAIVTGAGAGTAGIPSLMVKFPGEQLDEWHNSFDRELNLAQTLWDVGEESGKKIALVNWPVTFPLGGLNSKESVQVAGALNPPFRYFYMPLWDVASSSIFSDESFSCNQIPGRAVKIEPKKAEGWDNMPESAKEPLEFSITVPPTYVEGQVYNVLFYASEDDYDRVRICREKDASDFLTDIKKGDYGPWLTESYTNIEGVPKKGRFRFQLVTPGENGKGIKLYQSSINTADPYTVPASLTEDIEKAAGTFMEVDDPWGFMDQWLTDELYIEQIGLHADWWGKATKHVIENCEWDMAFTWVGTIDHMQHILYGGIEPRSRLYKEDKYEWCMDCIRQSYIQVDKNIGRILENVDLNEVAVAVVSDHGFSHLDWNPFVKEILSNEGLLEYVLDLSTDNPSNLKIDWSKTKCHPLEPCHAYIFINLKGREPNGIVEPEDYEKVQQQIINALYSIKNPENGENAVAVAVTKQEAGVLGVVEGEGFDRIGDVLYAWRPGYMSHPFIYRSAVKYRDGSERMISNNELCEEAVLGRNFTGVHLGVPALPEMHAMLLVAGGDIKKFERKHPAKIIDIAPTISKMMEMAIPKNAEGGILYDFMENLEK